VKDFMEIALKKLDSINSRLNSVDKTLVKQEENLKEHMRRTELLEKQQEDLIHDELVPIKSHIEQVKGISKFLMFSIPTLIALVTILYQYNN